MSQQLDLCPFGGEIATVENVCVYRYLMEQIRATLGGSEVKASAHNAGTWVQSLGREGPLEKEMATHSSILAWRIPWMEKPGGLQSTGLQRIRHN